MYLMSAFVATLVLIVWVWWPLVRDYAALFDPRVPIWLQIDWLLIGIFAAMSILIMVGADLRSDVWIVGVGLAGGLAIEGWGTQTHIWNYFTAAVDHPGLADRQPIHRPADAPAGASLAARARA